MTTEQLAALEAGRATPSLRALCALAAAFQVPFGVLLSGATCTTAGFTVLRADQGRVVDSEDGGFRTRALSATGEPREPEVYEVMLAAGWVAAAAQAPDTFEHIVGVRSGLGVDVADVVAVLAPGDAVFFRADRPHTYRNPEARDRHAPDDGLYR